MKLFEHIKNTFFRNFPSPNTIDRSGIVRSDYPVVGNGWIKGWVYNSNTIIVCKHSNPSVDEPNNKIYVCDNNGCKHERTIVNVDDSQFDIGLGGSYYNGGDIAICKLDKPLPNNISNYEIFTKTDIYAMKTVTINQHNEYSVGHIVYKGRLAYLKGAKRNIELQPGDSGLPWFVYDRGTWKICTHTHRGMHGEGPWYAKINSQITKRIDAL